MFKKITAPLADLNKFKIITPDGNITPLRIVEIKKEKRVITGLVVLIQSFKGLSVYTVNDEDDIYMTGV